MMNTLKLALVQTSITWENPELNRKEFSKKVESVSPDVDLIVLPEMFTSAFTMAPERLNPGQGKKTLAWMREIAIQRKAALAGSVIYAEDGKFFNRLLFVEPEGKFHHYDKRHTFTLAGEDEKYTAGKRQVIIEYKGFKINPMICYDLRFPVWSRNTAGYDVLLYVANWPKPRIDAWDTLLKARAIENMSYCIGVNRVGMDEKGLEYVGHSAVYDVLGKQLAFSDQEEVLEVMIDKNNLIETREKLRFLEDRDNFSLEY